MAKYSKNLDQDLVNKVKMLSTRFGLRESGVEIEAISLLKSNTYGEVIKANELTKLFTGKENVVAIAINEKLFLNLDEQTQTILIENLLEQIFVENKENEEAPKIRIEKPQINIGLRTYHQYGDIATQKLEAVILIMDQMAEQEKQLKEMQKAEKKLNKKYKNKN